MPDLFSKRSAIAEDTNGDVYDQQVVDRRRQRRRGDDEYPGEDGEFFRAPQRVRVRKSIIPETKWGRIAAGTAAFAVISGITAGVLITRNFLMKDERFRIATSSSIEIAGNTHVSRPQMLSIFGEDVERNVFHVPLSERREQLESLPWVEHATVMRLLPDRIRVSVVERTPVAYVRQGDNIRLVDANGVILDIPADAAGDPKYSFPVVTGINASDPAGTRAARMKLYARFIADIDSSGPRISEKLSEVDLSNPEDVKALIPDHANEVMVHFGDDKFLERYQKYEQHLPEWKQQYPKLASADMRYETQVVLEMGKESATPAPVAAASTAPVADVPRAASPAVAVSKSEVHPAVAAKPAPVKPAAIAKASAPVVAGKTKPAAAPVVDKTSGVPDEVASRLAGVPANKPVKAAAATTPAPVQKWKMPIAKPGQVAPPSPELLHKAPVTGGAPR